MDTLIIHLFDTHLNASNRDIIDLFAAGSHKQLICINICVSFSVNPIPEIDTLELAIIHAKLFLIVF